MIVWSWERLPDKTFQGLLLSAPSLRDWSRSPALPVSHPARILCFNYKLRLSAAAAASPALGVRDLL